MNCFIVDRVTNPYDLCVYIHQSKLTALQINEGEVVRIKTRNKDIIAKVRAAKRATFPVSNIQLNRCLRQNLGTYLGQLVTVEPCPDCKPADKVLLNPIEDTVRGIAGNFFELIRSSEYNFLDLPLQPEMVIPIYALGHVFEFKVKNCSPSPCVITSSVNNVQVNNQSVRRQKNSQFNVNCYDDIGGMKKIIKEIRRSIELPLLQPQIFQLFGISPHRGILLVAPHGCGKTFLSSCIRNETPAHYEHIPCLDLIAKSPDLTSVIFRMLCDRAISKQPSIVFIDDIDLIAKDQKLPNGQVDKRLKYTVLANVERLLSERRIVVLASATSTDDITPELLSNRLMHQIVMQKPNKKERVDIVTKLTRCYTIAERTTPEDLVEFFNVQTGCELQLNIQRIVQLKTVSLLEKIMNNNAPVQIDDLKAIIIGRKKFEELIKIINPTSDFYTESANYNNNNNFSAGSDNNNPFSMGNNQMSFISSPFGQSNNTEFDKPQHADKLEPNPQSQPKQQPRNPFATAGQSDPFAMQNNNNNSNASANQNPFNNQRPFQNNSNSSNGANFDFSQSNQSNNDPFQDSKNDPFASKPNPQSSDPFANSTNPSNQSDDSDQQKGDSKSKSKLKGKAKKEKTNPFSVRKK